MNSSYQWRVEPLGGNEGRRRVIEREDQEDRDRRVEEQDHEREEDAHQAHAGAGRARHPSGGPCLADPKEAHEDQRQHQGHRKQEEREHCAGLPVGEAGWKRSTIWFPYM